jgi:hypothetical protein
MRRVAVLAAGAALLVALTGCSSEFGGSHIQSGETNEDPSILQTKIKALMVDGCYRGDLQEVYPQCGKFITQLDSTTGSVDQLLAPRGRTQAAAAKQLRSGVDSYQQLGCDTPEEGSADQRTGCPAALSRIHDSLDRLASG